MLPEEKKKILKKKMFWGYTPYPFFMAILWFSKSWLLNIILITLIVIYVIVHHAYYMININRIEYVEIGF